MYNVFADFHHSALLNSLILLFEKRLGGKVYRPIGRDWYDRGYWKIYEHPATVAQYLDVGGATPDGTQPLNNAKSHTDGLYHCFDIDSNQTNKAITFDLFMEMPIDIVIASIPQHIEPFKRLCQLHPNKPKLIYQVGNAWDYSDGVMNVMASAKINVDAGMNHIEYHQEFEIPVIIKQDDGLIKSFVNCFSIDGIFGGDWQLFKRCEELSTNEFKCYGGQGRDGAIHGAGNVAIEMANSRYIWHTKAGGDGYGHVLHMAYALGCVPIIKKQYYAGKLAEILIDDTTSIIIDNLSAHQIVERLEDISEETRKQMSANAQDRFKQIVDFDREEKELRLFLARLQ